MGGRDAVSGGSGRAEARGREGLGRRGDRTRLRLVAPLRESDPRGDELREGGVVVGLLEEAQLLLREVGALHREVDVRDERHAVELRRLVDRAERALVVGLRAVDGGGDDLQVPVVRGVRVGEPLLQLQQARLLRVARRREVGGEQLDRLQRRRRVGAHLVLDEVVLRLLDVRAVHEEVALDPHRVRRRRDRQRLRDDRLVRADVEVGLQREKFVRHGGGAAPGPGRERG